MRPDVTMMAATLLPTPVRAFWAIVLTGVLAVFVRHAASSSSGDRRLWSGAYAVMTLGMIVMFLANPMTGPGPSPDAVAIMALAGVGALVVAAWMLAHREADGFSLPWTFTLVDLVILGYIQVPSPNRPIVVCSAMAAYLAVQVIARAVAAVRAGRDADARSDEVRGLVGAAAGPARDTPDRRGPQRPPRKGRTRTTSSARVPALVPASTSLLTLAMFYMISI